MPQLKPLVDADLLVYRCCAGNRGHNDFIQMVEAADDFIQYIEGMFEEKALLFLTGKNNFRYAVATLVPYKNNRKDKPRPRHFQSMREYLVNFHNARIVDGIEADDALATLHKEDTVLVTYDKDLRQCKGWYFNTLKNELIYISQIEADYNLYYQMLVGDSADAVPGIRGIGEKKAPPILIDKNKQEMEEAVMKEYKRQYGDNAKKYFDEVYTLLYLKRDCQL